MSWFGVLLYPLSRMRLQALLTNRLHHVSEQTGKLSAKTTELLRKGWASKNLKYRNSGEVEVGVPFWLDWQYCRYKLTCCCHQRNNNTMQLYKEIIELGHSNFNMNLDIVRVIRRNRLHAIGLHFLLNKVDRNLSARLAFSMPLRMMEDLERGKLKDPSDANEIEGETFYYIENLQKEDLFKFAFFKRFRRQISTMLFGKNCKKIHSAKTIYNQLTANKIAEKF